LFCSPASDREYQNPEKAARKLLEIANTIDAVQDGRMLHRSGTFVQFTQAGANLFA
jgi:hypothetical protein